MTKFSGGHGKEFDGNSILLKIKKDRYVFIGNTIYEFSIKNDKILKILKLNELAFVKFSLLS